VAKKTKASESTNIHDKNAPFTPAKILTSSKEPAPQIPTYDKRHTTAIRFGRISGEIFCRDPKRRRELGYDPAPTFESDFIEELRK
jgi:hypothetical protein